MWSTPTWRTTVWGMATPSSNLLRRTSTKTTWVSWRSRKWESIHHYSSTMVRTAILVWTVVVLHSTSMGSSPSRWQIKFQTLSTCERIRAIKTIKRVTSCQKNHPSLESPPMPPLQSRYPSALRLSLHGKETATTLACIIPGWRCKVVGCRTTIRRTLHTSLNSPVYCILPTLTATKVVPHPGGVDMEGLQL